MKKRTPVLYLAVRLAGGIEKGAKFFEFSELINAQGELFGLRSDNGAPFRLYNGPRATGAVPEPLQ